MKKPLIALGLLAVGNLSGQYLQTWYIRQRVNQVIPLMYDSITNIITAGIDSQLTPEEIDDLMQKELMVIRKAMREKLWYRR